MKRLAAILDMLLPPRCPGCGTDAGATHGLLCAPCFATVTFITDPFCIRCGIPFAASSMGPVCQACQDSPPRYNQARSALRYDDGARQLILPLKHADRVELAAILVPFMARAGISLLKTAELIVPVPLHRARLRARRYNQSALLACGLARLSGRPASLDVLQRIRETASLGGKTAPERAAELSGAIAVRPSRMPAIIGRHIVLVDDVMTSGATANACADALLTAGAKTIDVLAAARVPDPRTA